MSSLTSRLIYQDSPRYEQARIGRVFNHRRPERYPHGIIEVTTVQDVVDALGLAKELKKRVAIRSGGHSWAAWSVRDDSILLDLGGLKLLELDAGKNIVKASPSTTGVVLNEFLAKKGKMFGGGHCPDVALGGFLLQGGMGWNCRNWGWACEKITAIEVVTVEGEVLLCNKEQNSDLLWAACGAGPGFPAIVTAFYLEARDIFTSMMSSTFMWPLSEYKIVMDWVVKIAPKCDESIEVVALGLRPDPTGDILIMANFLTFQNSENDAISALRLANESHPPATIMESINKATSLPQEYTAQYIANPEKHRYISDNAYIDNDTDVTEVLRKAFTTLPENTKTFALWFSMNPCSQRPLPDMALSMHSDHYLALYTVWEHEKDDERCNKWVKNVMAGVEQHSRGAYLGDSDFQVRRTKFWEDSNARKLMELRRKWDPQGVICGYLDEGDKSGVSGLENVHEWKT